MPLNKSKGNMYTWVGFTHSHMGGICPHQCAYCYVDNPRFGRPERYKGNIRLIENELLVNYGSGKTIFIENMNDLFADEVPQSYIDKVLFHCRQWQNNTYVFQTKNPIRYKYNIPGKFGGLWIIGATIETNRDVSEFSKAPPTVKRMEAMAQFDCRKFITIEPIMDFDVDVLSKWIIDINPEFINIGADSKGHNLPEPSMDKVMELIDNVTEMGIEVREKHNLDRLKVKA